VIPIEHATDTSDTLSPKPQLPLRWIALAQLLRPQGRRGELLAELLTDLDPAIQFAAGRQVTLAAALPAPGAEPASAIATNIESFFLPTGRNAGRIVLKLAAANSISEAERLAGRQLIVPAAELPALEPDAFYVSDLVGCTLSSGGADLGTVVDVEFAMSPDGRTRLSDAAPLLAVRRTGEDEASEPVLVPFALAYLVAVDLAAKRIMMNVPPGLLDAEEEVDPDA
jgi:16S rRNA processing protein RimM